LVGKFEGRILLGRPGSKLNNNTDMDLRKIEWESVD
jgi:hypothetical protein